MSDDEDLVQRLCVVAGTIMEDASAGAVSTLGSDPRTRRRRVRQLRSAGADIALLLGAAAILERRLSVDQGGAE